MSAAEPTQAIAPREERTPIALGARGVELRTFEDLYRFAKVVADTDFAPKAMRGKPADIMVAIQYGMEIQLSPLQALQNIAVINGRPSIWGDAMLAVVRASGLLETFKETIDGEGAALVARCFVKRVGSDGVEVAFSWQDAVRAGLAKKDLYQQYPQRMLKFRARSWALRDEFGDVLKGLIATEEAQDIPPSSPRHVELRDVTNEEPPAIYDQKPPVAPLPPPTSEERPVVDRSAQMDAWREEERAKGNGTVERVRAVLAAKVGAVEPGETVEQIPMDPTNEDMPPEEYMQAPQPETMDLREAQGRVLAGLGAVTATEDGYDVQSGGATYGASYDPADQQGCCECEDWHHRSGADLTWRCKHLWAIVAHLEAQQPIGQEQAGDLRAAIRRVALDRTGDWLTKIHDRYKVGGLHELTATQKREVEETLAEVRKRKEADALARSG